MVLGGTIYSAMDGPGGPILGGTTYSMTAPLLGGRPRKAPKCTGDLLQVARWLRTVRKELFRVFFPTTSKRLSSRKPHLRRVWFARLEISCIRRNDRKGSIHTCEILQSEFREASYWPQNSLRSNLIVSKFQKFYALTTNLTTPNLMATSLCRYSCNYVILESLQVGY